MRASAETVLRKAFRVVAEDALLREGSDAALLEEPPDLEALIDEVLKRRTIRPHFFRPSMIGGCARQNVLHYRHAPTHPSRQNPRMLRILDNGTAIHEVVQGYLADHPEWWFAKESRVQVKVAGALIRGSCDGVMIRRRDLYRFGVEIKTMAHEGFMRVNAPTDAHKLQARIYAKLQGLHWIVVLYWDKDKQHLKAFPVKDDPREWGSFKERVRELKAMVDSGDLPKYDPQTCSAPDGFCEFEDVCRRKPGGVP